MTDTDSNSQYLKKNVGETDRVIRLIGGVLLIALPVYLLWSPWIAVLAAAWGGTLILEGLISY